MHAEPLLNDRPIPLLLKIPADRSERDAVVWASQQTEAIRQPVSSAGVVLIPGLDIATPEAFRALCMETLEGLRLSFGRRVWAY